jgi:hypothetical protein
MGLGFRCVVDSVFFKIWNVHPQLPLWLVGCCIVVGLKYQQRTEYIVEIWIFSSVPSTSQLVKCQILIKIKHGCEANVARIITISVTGIRNWKRKSVQ